MNNIKICILLLFLSSMAFAQQGELNIGDIVEASLSGRSVEYTITLEADSTITITLESDDFNPLIILEDSVGNEVAQNDNYGYSFNSKMTYTVAISGRYKVVVSDFDGVLYGDFTLTITEEMNPIEIVAPVRVNVLANASAVYGPDGGGNGIAFAANAPDSNEQTIITQYAVIPNTWEMLPAAEARYKIVFTRSTVAVETCYYGFSSEVQITRVQVNVEISIIDQHAMSTISSAEFLGAQPDQCPFEVTTINGVGGGSISGDLPSEDIVHEWIMTELLDLPIVAMERELAYGTSITIDASGFIYIPVSFSGQENDTVTITVNRGQPSTAVFTLGLYSSTGEELYVVTGAEFPTIRAFRLPETGIYTTRLRARSNEPLFGEFQISLEQEGSLILTPQGINLSFGQRPESEVVYVASMTVEAGELFTIYVEPIQPLDYLDLNIQIFEPGKEEEAYSDLSFNIFTYEKVRFSGGSFSFRPTQSGEARVKFESYNYFDMFVRAEQSEFNPPNEKNQIYTFNDDQETAIIPISVEQNQIYTITLRSDTVGESFLTFDFMASDPYELEGFQVGGFVRSSYSFVARETETLNMVISAIVFDPFDIIWKVE